MKYRNLFNTSILLFIFITTSISLMAQSNQKELDREFEWKKTDKTETIQINVQKGAKKLTMDLKGWISEGAFNLTVYDPEGNKAGWFSLVSAGDGGSHVHVETHSDGDHHDHSHVDVNQGSGSNVTVTTTTTTTTNGDNSDKKYKVKSKSKKKSKNGNSTYSMTNSDEKQAKGVMKKTISDPSPGVWKLIFEVEDATGALTAKVDQN